MLTITLKVVTLTRCKPRPARTELLHPRSHVMDEQPRTWKGVTELTDAGLIYVVELLISPSTPQQVTRTILDELARRTTPCPVCARAARADAILSDWWTS